jgi:hypothetical protein
MIFSSVGLPSRLAESCGALALELAKRSLGAIGYGTFSARQLPVNPADFAEGGAACR